MYKYYFMKFYFFIVYEIMKKNVSKYRKSMNGKGEFSLKRVVLYFLEQLWYGSLISFGTYQIMRSLSIELTLLMLISLLIVPVVVAWYLSVSFKKMVDMIEEMGVPYEDFESYERTTKKNKE